MPQPALLQQSTTPVPFLRWVGGKSKLLSTLTRMLPKHVATLRYVEPFFGSGALFFAVQPNVAVVADANPLLVKCVEAVRDRPRQLFQQVRKHIRSSGESYYYETREKYNRSSWTISQAARFIYLNRAGWNGVFRVNERGKYNVPYGHKTPVPFVKWNQFVAASRLLSNATIRCADFRVSLAGCGHGDFIYIDPPYPPRSNTSFFRHYMPMRFGDTDQKDLAELVALAAKKGAQVMMSNVDSLYIKRLYRGFQFFHRRVYRLVSCKAERRRVQEVVAVNYEVG